MSKKTFQTIVSAYTHFSFKLLHQFLPQFENQNLVFSPLSIAFGLSMCLNGASGKTKKEIEGVLGFSGLSLDDINHMNQGVCALFTQEQTNIDITLQNKLFIGNNVQIAPLFTEKLRHIYCTETQPIEEQNKIVLHNNINFKGRWAEGFDSEKTKKAFFKSHWVRWNRVPMMRSKDQYRSHYQDKELEVIRLRYGEQEQGVDNGFGMNIALPKSLGNFLSTLDSQKWNTLTSKLVEKKGNLSLPRFRVENTITLIDTFKALGIDSAFDTRADFSEMCVPPASAYITDAEHNTWVEVNEKGTEGVAKTSITYYIYGMRPKPQIQMNVNRPFFFTIQDNLTGIILYIGVIFTL